MGHETPPPPSAVTCTQSLSVPAGLQSSHLRQPRRGGRVSVLRQILQRSGDQQDGVQSGEAAGQRHAGDEAGAARDQRLVSLTH